MAKRRAKPQPKSGPSLGQLLRGELVGGVLVVLALMILLTLLSTNRGQVTAALVDSLRLLFGVGMWLVPFLLGAVGVWLALHEVTGGEVLSARRLAGGTGLFAVAETVAHLLANAADPRALAMAGEGGGLAGWLISQALLTALGLPATIGVLLVMILLSLFALSGLSWAEVRTAVIGAGRWLRGAPPGPDGLKVNPPLPLGAGGPPWRRWWRRLKDWLAVPPPSPPSSSPTWTGRAPAPSRTVAPPPVRGMGAPQPSAVAAGVAREPAPRVIGGSGQAWRLPPMTDILEDSSEQDIQSEDLRHRAQIIETTLEGFGLPVQVVEANQGPAVTQFGLRPGIIVKRTQRGEEKRIKVRVAQIQALNNDLSLALAASPIRIEAPVPGRDIVGVEVPNVQISLVSLRGVMESEEYTTSKGMLVIGLGRDVSGQAAVADLVRMPHLLIAGATGSGKSVCVNAIITALLLTHTPDTLRFLMIDPKRVELTVYNGVPHLIAPVVVDVERAVPVLQWATREMERRYKLFAKAAARNVEAYNEKLAARGEPVLPYIVILVDELADLMLSAPEEVERYVCRIAQMARATGIHLVIATQRPSVDVVTGLIKANFPARIAFAVTSQVDSRVILDTPGAEQLLGRGDMLFMAPDASKLQRLQGCFVSDRETQRLVNYWKGARTFGPEMTPLDDVPVSGAEAPGPTAATPSATVIPFGGQPQTSQPAAGPLDPPWLPGQEMLQQPLWDDVAAAAAAAGDRDDMYAQAVAEVRKSGRASVSLLQRRLRVGYSRAARLIEQMEAEGIVGPDMGGSRGREVMADAAHERMAGN
ncbi:MAG: DNA translocase FtsK 4TM domain-containing protein [Chloroflexi bacterium]|nr:DNA translocase FtsK 4TM domain-containing protein [Chloroflexota bacterium]